MPAPATHDFVHLEISSASVLNTGVNDPINYLIGRDTGSDDSIELEDSLEILSGSGGRYLRLPQGTSGQRPTGAAGLLRLNTTLGALDFHDGSGWDQPLTPSAVTHANLNANGDVGQGANQVAGGNHGHFTNALLAVEGTVTSSDVDGAQITLATFAVGSLTELSILFYVKLVSGAGTGGVIGWWQDENQQNASFFLGGLDVPEAATFGLAASASATHTVRWIKGPGTQTIEWAGIIYAD